MNDNVRYWIATAPVGAASVLAEELAQFGAHDIRERSHDVKFQGTLEVGYRACLWSRTATRVLLSLGSIDASSSKSVYEAVKRIDWREHLATGATLACDCSGGNESIRHTIYGSQLLKDAVCDNLRDATGERPNIKPERPDVLLHLHVEGPTALLSVDFSGESLHRRGYRAEGGRAPLKENVAAAVLLRAGWPADLSNAAACCSIPCAAPAPFSPKARLIAADAAPALEREYFGFTGWRGHDAALWERLRAEARARRARSVHRDAAFWAPTSMRMRCAWRSPTANTPASPNGCTWRSARLSEIVRPKGRRAHRRQSAVRRAHRRGVRPAGAVFGAWAASCANGSMDGRPRFSRAIRRWREILGIYAKRTHRFFNGTIECRLLRFELNEASEQRPAEAVRADWSSRPGAQMFANRLRKNLQRLDPWARTRAHRLLPRVRRRHAGICVRHRPLRPGHPRRCTCRNMRRRKPSIRKAHGSAAARRWRCCPEVLAVPVSQIHSRVRKPQKGSEQYEKRDSQAERHAVQEGGLKFWVNFRDYLDTGLFLDHRIVRGMLRDWAKGADFLNLFCYTGSATVYAAAGGARSSASVDLSNTYLDWAHENLLLNGFRRHRARAVSRRLPAVARGAGGRGARGSI